jgi:hypothetical protein
VREGETSPFGVIGKLPLSTDYARLGERGGELESLLDWLVDACERGATPPSRGGARAFVRCSGETLLAGVLSPSRDAAGRVFPAAAAAVASSRRSRQFPQLVPLLLERVWTRAQSLVSALVDGDDSVVDQLHRTEVLPTPAQVEAAYQDWLNDMTSRDLVELTFHGDPLAAGRAFALLDEACRPHAGRECPPTPLSLLAPLGRAGGALVCFWIDAVKRRLGWKRTLPSFFWHHDGAGGELLLSLGPTTPMTLGALWPEASGSSRAEHFTCHLAGPDSGFSPPSAATWQRRLASRASLSELLDEVGRAHREPRVGRWS